MKEAWGKMPGRDVLEMVVIPSRLSSKGNSYTSQYYFSSSPWNPRHHYFRHQILEQYSRLEGVQQILRL